MTQQAVHNYEDDEISLLDILVTLAESWKLLVFGPLAAAVLAGALSFLWPKTFESTAVVRLTEAEVAVVGTAPVLDQLIVKFDLLPEFDGNQDDARAYLAKKITGKFDKKKGLSIISVIAATPERAQIMNAAAISALQLELLPKGKDKDKLEQVIRSNEDIIAKYADAVERMKRLISKQGQNDALLEAVIKHFVTLNAEVAHKELENIELRKSLIVKGSEVYVQLPSLPQQKKSPKLSIVVLLALLASGFTLLLFVFIRKAWRSACQDEDAAAKIKKIKFALTKK